MIYAVHYLPVAQMVAFWAAKPGNIYDCRYWYQQTLGM